LITSSNVTVRQGPSAQAAVVGRLPLGTEVPEAADADLDKTWAHIAMPDGRDGWVLARLTRSLDPFWKWQTEEQVIVDRLARKGDGFSAAVELVNFTERVADTFSDPDARARMDLYRLKALQQALSAVPSGGRDREPYASWLSQHQPWIAYDEPGGRWLLANEAIWKVHDARMNAGVADELAWLSVTNGFGGECEGYLPCYLHGRNLLQGEYLRKHPAGAHAADAVSAIGETARALSVVPKAGSAYRFEPTTDCAPLAASLDALASAVDRAGATPDRVPTLEALAALRTRCQ
jgi:hypothetical protein